MSRLLISGTGSGCGKTTVTCALLAALFARGENPAAFKCGPDYIDPMFHRAVSGIPAYNLDPFFLNRDGLRSSLAAHGGKISIIEGAMGYYDGIASTDEASAYTVAKETGTPVVLVLSARGVGNSLGAVIEGFARHRPDSQIKGVIFNDAAEERYPDLQRIAENAGVQSYGYLPRSAEWEIKSRHLGLLRADEITDLQEKLTALGQQAERSFDIDSLLDLAKTASPLLPPPDEKPAQIASVRLAVAKDAAFCFHYQENLDLLRALGCELVFFSPLRERELPPNINGLYLCGGYPELHKNELAENDSMRESVQQAVLRGLPTIAECGGFLYLHNSLDGLPMCGVIEGEAFETKRLSRFGYITLTAEHDNLLCDAGGTIRSHEFHYWDSSSHGDGFTASKAGRGISYPAIHASDTLYAGFPHLFFPANKSFAKRFVERMARYEG